MFKNYIFAIGIICLFLFFTACDKNQGNNQPGLNITGHNSCDLSKISADLIVKAKEKLHIAYQHTSHGSQLITGMDCLKIFPDFSSVYSWDDTGAPGSLDLDDYGIPGCEDLSEGDSVDANGDTPWVIATRALLDDPDNSHINVIVWSWCSINGHDAQRYLDNMEKVITEYPGIVFVFMTGHAEGQSLDLTPNSVHYNNELIRAHCAENNRVLYDFADIESYDPDGNYFWDKAMFDNLNYSGDGNWAVEWIAANPGSQLTQLALGGISGYNGCSGCAHSDDPAAANLNCILKAQAAWSLWAYIADAFF